MHEAVWQYESRTQSISLLRSVHQGSQCPCCEGVRLRSVDSKKRGDGRIYSEYEDLLCCEHCGWWFASYSTYDSSCGCLPDRAFRHIRGAGAALRTFSSGPSSDQMAALKDEIADHLGGRGQSVSWRVLEHATTGVFREFGYQARVTEMSRDGGIDVIVDHPSLGEVFAQVKHSRNKIGVRVFRELVGTMAVRGVARSLLVTSSGFTGGVTREQALAGERGFFVELVDGSRLLSSLNLTYRQTPPTLADVAAIAKPSITLFHDEIDL